MHPVRTRWPFAVLALVALAGASFGQARSADDQAPSAIVAVLAGLDRELATEFEADGVGGAAVGVVAGPNLVWARNYGDADMEAGRPATSDSAYRIGSITKQFTALAVLQAVEQGKMRLSDPIEKYVPEVRRLQDAYPGTPPVTVLQVGTMTAGIAREPECEGPLDGPISRWVDKLLECIPGTGYANEPGTRYLYSNIGYAILGLAVERAVGMPFTRFVDEHTFTPLGMTRTAFEPTDAIREDLAHGYRQPRGRGRGRRGQAPPDVTPAPPSREQADRELDGRGYKVPNGAILSTLADMARFVAWELGEGPDGVLSRDTQASNYRRVSSATNARGELTLSSGYGLGFQATRRGDVVMLGHGGSTAGYHASALFHRETKLGVVVLRGCDSCAFDAGPVAARVLLRLVAAVRDADDSGVPMPLR
jgi:CubicO group peptidase (beta-lactamase class C family)